MRKGYVLALALVVAGLVWRRELVRAVVRLTGTTVRSEPAT
jgi:hypothetical protein